MLLYYEEYCFVKTILLDLDHEEAAVFLVGLSDQGSLGRNDVLAIPRPCVACGHFSVPLELSFIILVVFADLYLYIVLRARTMLGAGGAGELRQDAIGHGGLTHAVSVRRLLPAKAGLRPIWQLLIAADALGELLRQQAVLSSGFDIALQAVEV